MALNGNLERCLTAEEVAEIFNVSRARIYELCRQGFLPHIKLGRQIRFNKQALEEFMRKGGKSLPGGWRWEGGNNNCPGC